LYTYTGFSYALPHLPRVLAGALEDQVFERAEGALGESDVVGDDDDGAAGWELGRGQRHGPGHHADLVGAGLLHRVEGHHAGAIVRESELDRRHLWSTKGGVNYVYVYVYRKI